MDSRYDFLPCHGELAELIRTFNWEATPVGPFDQWPDSLKTILNIVLTSNHPMFIWWGPDLIQFYNDAYRKTMGPERHPGALGQRGRECWQEIWPIIGPQIDSIMAGGASTWHEDQLVPVTRHGKLEEVWWTYGYSPIRDASGVQGVLVICNDVTKEHLVRAELECANERLAKEVSLRRHEAERLKVLFQQAPGFTCVLRGPQHIFEFANNAYLRLVGNREILGKSVREALPETEGQGFLELLDQVFATGNPFFAQDVPLSLRLSPDSSLTQLFVDFVYQPITEPDDRISGIFVAGFDVTEQRHTREALYLSEERMKEGTVAARMGVWDWDLAKSEFVFNANIREVYGITLEKLPQPWKLLHPDDVSIMWKTCQQALADRGSFQATVRIIQPDNGKICWVAVSGKVLCNDSGKPIALRGVVLDVTERKCAEEKLKEADQRKNEFLAMLAHELRNPLAPINAAAQLLKSIQQDEARIKQVSDIITRQVGHMTHMINDLLDVTRIAHGQIALEKQCVDLGILLMEAVEQVHPLMEERAHRLMLPQTIGPFPVSGDHKRLVQVIANLLNNAAKYTPEGGVIQAHLESAADDVLLAIQDNGIGIDREMLPHVFEIFVQAKHSTDGALGGLGIGLSLVKGLVEAHGGRITLASNGLGTGTKVTVLLPRLIQVSVTANSGGNAT
jgi:PAS domain S-box-containing protein